MWKILLKTVPVNLKRDIATYILMGLLVAAGMYIASAFSGITYSCAMAGDEISRISNSEDGQFQTILPLSDQVERSIAQEGYTLERAFYFDVGLEDGSTLRVMKTRKKIDKIILDDGALPQTDKEAVLEKCYAFHHELHVSDTIRISDVTLRLSGIGSVVDYNSPSVGRNDFSSDSIAFGVIFVTDDCYRELLTAIGSDTREMCIYAYKLADGTTDETLRSLLVNDMGLLSRLVAFVPKANNNRMGASTNDNYPYAFAGMITGIGLLVLISMIFFLRIQFSLDKQSPSVGALLAMGVKKRDIYPMLLLPFALVAFIGGLVGFGLSRVFTLSEVVGSEGYYSVPEIPMITHPLIFLYCAVMPPVVCTAINLLLLRKKMNQPEVSLLRSSQESSGNKGGIAVAMTVGSLIAATIFMLGRGVGLYCTTVKERLPIEIRYNYVYELSETQTEVPENAQGTFRHSFSLDDHGYIRDIQFIGIEDGNPYFDAQVSGLGGGVVISSSVASRYGLDIGDTLSVFDPITTKPYSFCIKGITDYSVMLTVFMEISELRTLLGENGIAYNMIYSDIPLDYERSQLFSALTKEKVIEPVETLEPEVQSSRDLIYALSILFYAVTMIYLIQFAVVLKRRDTACLSALGYRNIELIRFVAGKLTILACVSAIVSLFIGYRISLLLMPTLLASVPIGLMIDYNLSEYLLHLAVALVIIFISVLLGIKRITKTDNMYYLRSRE